MDHDSPDANDPQRQPQPRHVPVGRRSTVDPASTGISADRVTAQLASLAHELNNLLDGAVRYVAMAQRGLSDGVERERSEESATLRQLASAETALLRMATLIREAMAPGSGSLVERFSEPRPLVESIVHACDVLRPLADEREIEIFVEFSPRLVLTEAGPLYPVVANALRNSIEAIGRGGRIEIIAELTKAPDGSPQVQIDILDDGPGPPADDSIDIFSFDYSSKRKGPGVGLALSREIISELGGSISLSARGAEETTRRGAHLTIRTPLLTAES